MVFISLLLLLSFSFGDVCHSCRKPGPTRSFTKRIKPLLNIHVDDVIVIVILPFFLLFSCLIAYRGCARSTWILLHGYNSQCIARAQRIISPESRCVSETHAVSSCQIRNVSEFHVTGCLRGPKLRKLPLELFTSFSRICSPKIPSRSCAVACQSPTS